VITVRARKAAGGWLCDVDVKQGGQNSQHVVAVAPADLERWAGGREEADVVDLVRRSFEFLLLREPPGSILGRFDLSVIPRFFPEYDRLFAKTQTE
jgi:hypothetical protein